MNDGRGPQVTEVGTLREVLWISGSIAKEPEGYGAADV